MDEQQQNGTFEAGITIARHAHPTNRSWDGHADRYQYDQERLRTKLAEWDANDTCRGFPLSSHQKQQMSEAREFADKPYSDRPAPSVVRAQEQSVWDNLREYLPDHLVTVLGAITVAAAAALVACLVTAACEIALILAGAGALVVMAVTAALRAAGAWDEPATA